MEETINIPTHSYRSSYFLCTANGDPMHTETVGLNKKRKFPAEQLGLPSPKHISLQSSYLESGFITNAHRKELNPSLLEVESSRRLSDDISQSGSTKDGNCFYGGNTTTMSLSGQIRNDIWYSEASSSNQPSTSSINWASTCSTKSLYSLESRSMAKSSSSSDETESSYNIGKGRDADHNNFGSHSTPYYDGDHEIEFLSHDYTCSELGHDNMEQCSEDEDQGGIYSNGVIADNYVLSSGRWSVNQENEQGAKKLTIDKEFEEYFSSLML